MSRQLSFNKNQVPLSYSALTGRRIQRRSTDKTRLFLGPLGKFILRHAAFVAVRLPFDRAPAPRLNECSRLEMVESRGSARCSGAQQGEEQTRMVLRIKQRSLPRMSTEESSISRSRDSSKSTRIPNDSGKLSGPRKHLTLSQRIHLNTRFHSQKRQRIPTLFVPLWKGHPTGF